MGLTDPTWAVTTTLDGPVLAALASAGKPLTVGDVAALMPRGVRNRRAEEPGTSRRPGRSTRGGNGPEPHS